MERQCIELTLTRRNDPSLCNALNCHWLYLSRILISEKVQEGWDDSYGECNHTKVADTQKSFGTDRQLLHVACVSKCT